MYTARLFVRLVTLMTVQCAYAIVVYYHSFHSTHCHFTESRHDLLLCLVFYSSPHTAAHN